MTTLEPFPEPTTPTEPWGDLFAKLQLRYPKVREPIVAALTALIQNPGIDVDHAKAVAAANGMRITAASVAAAERLLSRQDRHDEMQTATRPTAPATPASTPPGNAEAERLRETMRRAVLMLTAAIA
jgi:hypothetical protein